MRASTQGSRRAHRQASGGPDERVAKCRQPESQTIEVEKRATLDLAMSSATTAVSNNGDEHRRVSSGNDHAHEKKSDQVLRITTKGNYSRWSGGQSNKGHACDQIIAVMHAQGVREIVTAMGLRKKFWRLKNVMVLVNTLPSEATIMDSRRSSRW